MSARADNLVAAIVQQSVDEAFHTSQVLLAHEKSNARRLAAALLALDKAIDMCPVVDRRLLDAQARFAVVYELAEHYVTTEEA